MLKKYLILFITLSQTSFLFSMQLMPLHQDPTETARTLLAADRYAGRKSCYLHGAAETNNSAFFTAFVRAGADLDEMSAQNETPLDVTMRCDSGKMAYRILSEHCDTPEWKKLLWQAAILNGNSKMIRHLSEQKIPLPSQLHLTLMLHYLATIENQLGKKEVIDTMRFLIQNKAGFKEIKAESDQFNSLDLRSLSKSLHSKMSEKVFDGYYNYSSSTSTRPTLTISDTMRDMYFDSNMYDKALVLLSHPEVEKGMKQEDLNYFVGYCDQKFASSTPTKRIALLKFKLIFLKLGALPLRITLDKIDECIRNHSLGDQAKDNEKDPSITRLRDELTLYTQARGPAGLIFSGDFNPEKAPKSISLKQFLEEHPQEPSRDKID